MLYDPQTQSYCVIVVNEKKLKLVSRNNADDAYGNEEQVLKKTSPGHLNREVRHTMRRLFYYINIVFGEVKFFIMFFEKNNYC